MAAIAAHLGIVDQEQINNMSIIFFDDVLAALGKKLNYQAVANLYGNSFAKDAGKYIQKANPLYKEPKISHNMMDLFNKAAIIKPKTKDEATQNLSAVLGDVSWAKGLFDK